MADNKFSKLLFDRSKIPSMINNWCELNLEGDYKINHTDSSQRAMYSIITADKEIKIDFINAKGGAITIFPGVGKNQDASLMIAEYIYDNIAPELSKTPFSNGLSIKMSYDDFVTIINFLDEYDDIERVNYSKKDEVGKAKYELYKYKSVFDDTVVLKYYTNTKRLQIQGKPLYLFNEIISLIGLDEKKADAIVDAHIEMCNLDLTKEEIDGELLGILGEDLYSYLTITQRAFLNSSIVLSKIRVDNLEDYSYIVTPALKAYEGFLLKILRDEGVSLPKNNPVGAIFGRSDKNVDFKMNMSYTTGLSQKKIDIFEKMYNYYSRNRHPYMHCTESDVTTVVISSFDNATTTLNGVISAFKSHYCEYNL